ncbi:MAG: bifunctional enoyl-CoA hydratase/phosphate acetyltransferase [Roseicyclus sp.]|uniref:bifunctional enoyl-CoA hydratase/phosphate acetyltransferase n=1 Tax=Boseongicola sp. H5 TaxID=2763261 RepID=UPI001B016D85|nr:bifunctional enoyl-CoA hydratase/phosphate acetyltransferase [Boseongicola sp. H5]MBO6601877.1 bifunctional enoyl-CoA hydratase/phosphate acetyltransferase [Roseicyclus sp.]MBO6623238.1 bifunctional enoyl-CoA hydratase/phosphate acetyltransferase [Roseicyclus sp.]MBO6922085.1 bifunctional enoyl-CoA hydratase/phosphate acetyltransferase [Roseicyclus sp.]
MPKFTTTPYDAIEPGMQASLERLCLADDLYVFANSSGNLNPMHLPKEDGDGDGRPEAVAPSAWLAALISGVLGNQLPGPGTLYLDQSLRFLGRAHAGDTLTAAVRVIEKLPENVVRFEIWVDGPEGRIAEGEARVIAPAVVQHFDVHDLPGLTVQRHVHFDRLLEMAAPLPAIPTSVVAPETPDALMGALLARDHTLIDPILVGSARKIAAAAEEAGGDLGGLDIIDIPDHRAAALRAVALVHEGRARAVMKGHLHTDQILHAVLKKEGGLRTNRRLSHVFVMDVPGLTHLLFVTDAAINITPDLDCKMSIVQNAIDLALALGVEQPKVGILSAVETVTASIPSTLDAAILSKMADRGQITGGLVDGPLAMDNAVDLDAARTKGLKGLVAGRADILVAPNMESGNMLAKQLTFLAHAEAGGIVMGAQVPIILTSRADDDKARLASCAIAALYAASKSP